MDNMYALTAGEAGEIIAHSADVFFRTGIYNPVMLWGDPGVGKTQAADFAAMKTGAALITQHVADREPTEIGGIMWEKDGKMIRLPPDLPMEDKKPTILFYDETPQAPMMNKNLLARVVLDRNVAGFNLGDQVYVCLAGNYAHNRAGTSAMPSHLNARLTHIHVIPNVDQWNIWAATKRIHPFVTTYMKSTPGDHHIASPDKEAGPNPRSWSRVSQIEFSGYAPMLRKSMIVGTIGKEVAERYLAQTELYANMPDPDLVLANPKTAPIPDNRTTLYALVEALAAKAKPNNIGAIIEYTNRLTGDEEYQSLCLREARLRNPAVTSTNEYTRFAMSPKGQGIA